MPVRALVILDEIDPPARALLERCGFDAARFERLRELVATGALGTSSNVVTGQVEPPEPGDLTELPAPGDAAFAEVSSTGVEALRAGHVGLAGARRRHGDALRRRRQRRRRSSRRPQLSPDQADGDDQGRGGAERPDPSRADDQLLDGRDRACSRRGARSWRPVRVRPVRRPAAAAGRKPVSRCRRARLPVWTRSRRPAGSDQGVRDARSAPRARRSPRRRVERRQPRRACRSRGDRGARARRPAAHVRGGRAREATSAVRPHAWTGGSRCSRRPRFPASFDQTPDSCLQHEHGDHRRRRAGASGRADVARSRARRRRRAGDPARAASITSSPSFVPTTFLVVPRRGPRGRFFPIKVPVDLDTERDALREMLAAPPL